MNFEPNDDQVMLRDSVRRWVENEYSFEARQARVRAGGFDRACWQAMADFGWLGVSLPEAYGGIGGGMVDAALTIEELGRALVLESYLAHAVLPAQLLLHAAPEAQRESLLGDLVSGAVLWSVAHVEVGARDAAPRLRAQMQGGAYRLNGVKLRVPAAAQADRLLVSARLDDGAVALFALAPDAAGVTLREYRLIDGSPAADVELNDVVVAAADAISLDAAAALAAAHDATTIGACAEMIGAMEHALWTTRDYLRTRKQFGVAIGTFQALQHRMADMYMSLEQARAMLYRGLAHLEAEPAVRSEAASASKAQVGRCAQFVTAQAIQLHGGIGVTDEYPVGHYFKHVMVLESYCGGISHHTGRLARALRTAA